MSERHVHVLRSGRRAAGDGKLVVFAHAHTDAVTVAKWHAHTDADGEYCSLAAGAAFLCSDVKNGFAVDIAVAQGRCGVIQIMPVVLQPDLWRELARSN